MKIDCNSLCCPACGASKFHLFANDVFICECCSAKFHYDLDNVDFVKEKIVIEEIKLLFQDKINELYAEKNKNLFFLLECKKLAYPKKLTNIAIIGLIISIFSLFSLSTTSFSLIGVAVFSVLFFLSKVRSKKKFLIYEPCVTYYAKIIVDLQNEIDLYNKLISKLTK